MKKLNIREILCLRITWATGTHDPVPWWCFCKMAWGKKRAVCDGHDGHRNHPGPGDSWLGMLRAEQTQLDSKKAHGEKSLPYAVFDRLVHLPGPKGLSRQLGVSCGTFRGSIWTSVAIRWVLIGFHPQAVLLLIWLVCLTMGLMFYEMKMHWGVGAMAESVKCLSWKHNDLSSIPSIHIKTGWSNTCLWSQYWKGWDRQIPRAWWPISLAKLVSSKFSDRCCLKKIKWSVIEEETQSWPLVSKYTYTLRCIHTNLWEALGKMQIPRCSLTLICCP